MPDAFGNALGQALAAGSGQTAGSAGLSPQANELRSTWRDNTYAQNTVTGTMTDVPLQDAGPGAYVGETYHGSRYDSADQIYVLQPTAVTSSRDGDEFWSVSDTEDAAAAIAPTSIHAPNFDPDGLMDPKRSGLYVLEKAYGGWKVTHETQSVETDKAAINGMLNQPGYAAWLMSQHVEKEFGEGVDKFTLFYNPTKGAFADGLESLRDKLGFTTEVAKQFSEVLKQSQNSGRQVDWVAHSQGGIIFSEAVRVSQSDLSNNSVAFHSGANNQWVTNSIMEGAGVRVIGYRDHPFDPVPNIAGFNTLNPVKLIGSVFALPFVIWGGPEQSPHTLPYVKKAE